MSLPPPVMVCIPGAVPVTDPARAGVPTFAPTNVCAPTEAARDSEDRSRSMGLVLFIAERPAATFAPAWCLRLNGYG